MNENVIHKKRFFPSIKLKRFKLSRKATNESVKPIFFDRSPQKSPQQDLTQQQINNESDLSCNRQQIGFNVNFRKVELKGLEDEKKDKQIRMREISTLYKNKPMFNQMNKRQMKRKEVKKCNNKVFRSSKSEEFFGISQEYVFNIKARKIVKIKTDISEEMKGVKYCEYERQRNSCKKKKNSISYLGKQKQKSRLSPWRKPQQEQIYEFQ